MAGTYSRMEIPGIVPGASYSTLAQPPQHPDLNPTDIIWDVLEKTLHGVSCHQVGEK